VLERDAFPVVTTPAGEWLTRGGSIHDPSGQPVNAGGYPVRQGSIEEPNGDTVMGMIDLVTIQRAYTANLDALKAMDGVLGTIAGETGRG
jgi:flagellar basal body rod protein FlgG